MVSNYLTEDSKVKLESRRKNMLPLPILMFSGVLVLYFVLALFRIGTQSLWNDEVLSLRSARIGEPLFSSLVWRQYHGPLYFVLLHLWAKLGTSETIVRTLSVLSGAAALCFVYAIGLRLFDTRVALLTSVLVATSPFFVWYSQEVRYITLMIATAVLSMWALWRALSSQSLVWWLFYAGSVALALFSFVTCLFFVFAHGAFLASSRSYRPLLLKWIFVQIPFFALFVWWAGHTHYAHAIVDQGDDHQQSVSLDLKRLSSGGRKELSPAVVPYTFFALSTGFSVGPSLEELHVSPTLASLGPYVTQIAVIGIIFGGLFICGVSSLWGRPQVGKFLGFSLAVPILGTLLVATLTSMTYNVRYVAMVFPVFCLVLAAGINGLRKRSAQIALLMIILLANGYSLANYYFNRRYAREDARSAAQYLTSTAGAKDAILVVGSQNSLRYYYKGNCPILFWGQDVIADRPAITKLLSDLRPRYERVWFLTIRPWEKDPKGKLKALLDWAYPLVQEKQFAGIGVYCYKLNSSQLRTSSLSGSTWILQSLSNYFVPEEQLVLNDGSLKYPCATVLFVRDSRRMLSLTERRNQRPD